MEVITDGFTDDGGDDAGVLTEATEEAGADELARADEEDGAGAKHPLAVNPT